MCFRFEIAIASICLGTSTFKFVCFEFPLVRGSEKLTLHHRSKPFPSWSLRVSPCCFKLQVRRPPTSHSLSRPTTTRDSDSDSEDERSAPRRLRLSPRRITFPPSQGLSFRISPPKSRAGSAVEATLPYNSNVKDFSDFYFSTI